MPEPNSAPISALEGLYLAMLGGARALGLEDHVGSLQPGREADLVCSIPMPRGFCLREPLALHLAHAHQPVDA
ncbi:MAG: amidohydrolase family protein [Methyloceanibacter sp.]